MASGGKECIVRHITVPNVKYLLTYTFNTTKSTNLVALSAGECVFLLIFFILIIWLWIFYLNEVIDCTKIHLIDILFTIIYEENNH